MIRREILAGTVSAAASDSFTVDGETVGVIAVGLAGIETGTLQVSASGTTFADVYIDGNIMQLTATNNIFTVYGPGIYRINKSATAGSVSIHTAS